MRPNRSTTGGRGDRADAALPSCRAGRSQNIQIKRGLFVGMALAKRRHDGVHAADRHDRFQSDFLHLFELPWPSDDRLCAFLAEKCSSPRRTKTARRIVADVPRPGLEQCPADPLDRVNRNERHQFVLRRLRLRQSQRTPIRYSQHIGQHVIGSPLGHVQGRMRRINRHAPANRIENRIPRDYPLQRMKDRRMVRDHQIAFVQPRLPRPRPASNRSSAGWRRYPDPDRRPEDRRCPTVRLTTEGPVSQKPQ